MRTPTILQVEAAECGAAALGIIAAHHGLWLTLEDLRARCGVSRDGSKAQHVVAAARELGFEVRAVRCEPEALAEVECPAILHWGMDHFLVLEGRSGGQWCLNDPARGRRRVDDRELRRQFSGILIMMKPGPAFQKGGSAPSALRGLADRLKGGRAAVWLAIGISLMLAVPGVLQPSFRQVFLDRIMSAHVMEWLWPIVLVVFGAGLFAAICTWMQKTLQHNLETRVAVRGGIEFMERVLRLPLSFYGQRGAAGIADRVMLNDRVAGTVAKEIGGTMLALIMAVTYLAVLILFDWRLGLVSALGAATLGLALLVLSARLQEDQQRLLNEQGLEDAEAKQGLRMIDSYRASGTEALLFDRLTARRARALNLRQSLMLGRTALKHLPGLVTTIAAAAAIGVGGGLIIDGEMSIGALVAFLFLQSAFLAPVGRLVQLGPRLQEAGANLRLLDDTLRHPLSEEFTKPPPAPRLIRRLAGKVELRDVTFGHSRRAAPLITDVSLTIEPGERVGIVGASGSGKSTLALLAAGLHEPWSGQVLLDDKPIRDIPRAVLRQSVQVVDQNGFLFTGTVRDNIAMWDPTVSEERLHAAARDAVIHDFILDRREGYAFPVTGGGANLSGGQRARIEIARALVQDPRILVFDEATAALDDETEAELLSNIRRRGATMLVIAHRLAPLRDCDRVVVMERGRIVEMGPPGELAARRGAFARLMLAEA
ncbi:ATP-binding cassette domain-containing protein [Roseomonas stagni]|uniref:ATP-binding cassette domain-containing protein n=1 Tax=Falsiroseomonas algicola TaxID=2716930 RepID=A0A6M1LLN8_9PROT|nr:cysteine peptidase family C39 domain-containing protein [Falsiroseomonas algicola]NGM21260.1 ATP-binding cassette domain-containing protein [Falsiroseomonas algicola]